MEKGFNSDIQVKGVQYHVQTEDWGPIKPFIVSQVFCSGAIVKSIKITYEEVLKEGPRSDARAVRLALRQQHQEILDLLISGQLLR